MICGDFNEIRSLLGKEWEGTHSCRTRCIYPSHAQNYGNALCRRGNSLGPMIRLGQISFDLAGELSLTNCGLTLSQRPDWIKGNKPFRLFNSCLENPSYIDLVLFKPIRGTVVKQYKLQQKLRVVKVLSKQWTLERGNSTRAELGDSVKQLETNPASITHRVITIVKGKILKEAIRRRLTH